jgi:hypothetical protein
MRVIILLLGALIFASPASCQVLSWQGLGPVRLGMTIQEAERALMTSFRPRDIAFTDECWITQRADGKDDEVYYEVQNGKIVIITVAPDLTKHGTTKITDTRGLGVGATEADIRKAYGDLKARFAPYFSEESEIEAAKERARLGVKLSEPLPSPEYWIEVESPNHERAIIFNTRDSKVLWLRTGFKPAVTEMEGCS